MWLPFLKRGVHDILESLKLSRSFLEITLADDQMMRRYNRRYMGKTGTTDVLSFPQIALSRATARRGRTHIFDGQFLGDILVSLDQAERQAKVQGLSLKKEVLFLILHSILHLIGHDHATKAERERMQKLECKIWRKIS
jgi:probable rRNA maturation factor